jgi:LPPG:FO 2-phospho-L-lactate transferase
MNVVVLCGGVGAARFLRGLMHVVPAKDLTAVVNTGDDLELHGLTICPDLDTITYTVADAIDPGRGWGLENETWTSLQALERFEAVRPADSTAATTWFGLGDKDLATHLYRTHRLTEGATLTTVTAEIAKAWEVPFRLLPMSDDPIRTHVETVDYGTISFQEYFVRHRHNIAVRSLKFAGATTACVSPDVLQAITHADRIIIAPSNPFVSIGPLRALPDLERALQERRENTVAISPLVGGKALKGPADRLLSELGYEVTQKSIATIYNPIASSLLIDTIDADQAPAIAATGMTPIVTNTIMSDLLTTKSLAQTALQT